MPTYEYRCPSCGSDFEKFQRMSDEPGADCPSCGAPAQRRLSGGAGFLFKGSGFYITDYRGESYKKAAGADKAPDGESKSADSKPEKGKPAEKKAGDSPSPASSKSTSND
jgi:putative FmdB family regulatory protein